jgi:transposase
MIAKRSKLIEPRFVAGRHHVVDDQERAVAAQNRERARRALWADCERRPISHDFPPPQPQP